MTIQERFSAAGSVAELYALLPYAMPLDGATLLNSRPGLAGCYELDIKMFADIPVFSWDALLKLPTSGDPRAAAVGMPPKSAEAASA